MKEIRILIAALVCGSILASCHFLSVDEYFDDSLKFDSIFANKRNIEKYLWNIAVDLPQESNMVKKGYTPGPCATDIGFSRFSDANGVAYTTGEVTASELKTFDIWGSMYKVIRRCNLVFNRIDEATDMTNLDKLNVLAYARFIRAYAYYHLLMQYGPVILVGDNVYESNEEVDYYNNHRATYDECVDYICSELETAANFLPKTMPVNYFGRPTAGAAYGLVARLRLQHASPLFNGGAVARRIYGDWKRSVDGVNYISQVYDEKRWAVAAAAAKRVMDMQLYSLHTVPRDPNTPALPAGVPDDNFPNGAGDIDPYHSYSDMFTGEAVAFRNPEFVWGRDAGTFHDILKDVISPELNGWNGLCVTQKAVDAFYMRDGRDIYNSSEAYPYSEEGRTTKREVLGTNMEINSGISNMYANREMRFYASIGYCERTWTCNSSAEAQYRNYKAKYYYGSGAGKYGNPNNPDDYPATGYVLTKYVHPDDAIKGTNSRIISKAFGIIRYAEILLSYAEALNNLTQTHTVVLGEQTYTVSRDIDEIRRAFNQIRYRVALPGMTVAEASDATTVQNLIVRERMIEFLFENRRFFDVRRWGIYEEVDSEPMMGMDVSSGEEGYYNRVPVNEISVRNRIVDPKLIFLPISRDEIRKMKDLDQNPGWES